MTSVPSDIRMKRMLALLYYFILEICKGNTVARIKNPHFLRKQTLSVQEGTISAVQVLNAILATSALQTGMKTADCVGFQQDITLICNFSYGCPLLSDEDIRKLSFLLLLISKCRDIDQTHAFF